MLEGYGMGHAICPEFHRAFTQWLAEPDTADGKARGHCGKR